MNSPARPSSARPVNPIKCRRDQSCMDALWAEPAAGRSSSAPPAARRRYRSARWRAARGACLMRLGLGSRTCPSRKLCQCAKLQVDESGQDEEDDRTGHDALFVHEGEKPRAATLATRSGNGTPKVNECEERVKPGRTATGWCRTRFRLGWRSGLVRLGCRRLSAGWLASELFGAAGWVRSSRRVSFC